jgi:hypothetical protein
MAQIHCREIDDRARHTEKVEYALEHTSNQPQESKNKKL